MVPSGPELAPTEFASWHRPVAPQPPSSDRDSPRPGRLQSVMPRVMSHNDDGSRRRLSGASPVDSTETMVFLFPVPQYRRPWDRHWCRGRRWDVFPASWHRLSTHYQTCGLGPAASEGCPATTSNDGKLGRIVEARMEALGIKNISEGPPAGTALRYPHLQQP